MRELREFRLPGLIASRNSTIQSSNEINSVPTTQSHSPDQLPSAMEKSWSSWTASDSSVPSTPTYSAHSHSRHPSSNSSVASTSSPTVDVYDVTSSTATATMPKLPEDPSEREDQVAETEQQAYTATTSPSFDDSAFEEVLSARTTVILRDSAAFDFGNDVLCDAREPTRHAAPKRQPSMESPVSIISTKLGERFPSFSRRRNHKKKDSKIADAGLRISTSSRPPSTRSSSLTSSMYQSVEHIDRSPVPLSRKTSAAGHKSAPVSPIDIERTHIEEPIDRKTMASTPLLPPMVTALPPAEDEAVTSPLQSPTIAEPGDRFSTISSPVETPQLRELPSPPLSTKPSFASFHRARVGTLPSSDVPPLIIADPADQWAIKLGHANFTIFPEPYMPDSCTAETYQRLVADWEQAHFNYFKHRHRTLEHYGAKSKTYKLTEQKWADIDAQWRRNKDIVGTKAAKISDEALPTAPEPLVSLPMPAVHDLKNDGKFPILGDEGIVGPMKVEAPRIQPEPIRRNAFLKFFDGFKTPTSIFGKARNWR